MPSYYSSENRNEWKKQLKNECPSHLSDLWSMRSPNHIYVCSIGLACANTKGVRDRNSLKRGPCVNTRARVVEESKKDRVIERTT